MRQEASGRTLDPTYKANRPRAEAALHHQIDLAREALEADGFPVWKVDGFEGDDLIATAALKISSTESWHKVLIASADKDLLALVSDRVEVHSTRTGNRIGPTEVKEKLGVDPCQVADYLCLVGDVSDNIRGAKGIGHKTASALLKICGNLDDVYVSIDAGDVTGLKPAQLASLAELRPRLESVRALVTMRSDVPLDVAEVFKPRVPKVAETFMEDEMGDRKAPVPVDRSQLKPDPPPAPPPQTLPLPHQSYVSPKPEALEPAPPEWERGLEPRSMDDACLLARRMHESRMFSAYGTPQAVLSTVLLGRELGLPAMASLRSVHIIKGKHSLSADLMVALVLRSGMAEYFQVVESTETVCTFETKRQGAPRPQKLSYTIDDAKNAGLLAPPTPGKEPSPWHKMPKQMLRARAKSELARLEYPDLLAGLYTPEELRDAKVEGA